VRQLRLLVCAARHDLDGVVTNGLYNAFASSQGARIIRMSRSSFVPARPPRSSRAA
jgi:hypothetical protein